MEKAVILTSGGINSAVAAAVTREKYEPALLHVAWGHRAADRELIAFEHIATELHIEKTMVAELSCMAAFGGNPRVSRRMGIEDATTLGKGSPVTFMLGLIPSMLSLAATWANSIGAKRIIIGINENHYTRGSAAGESYPDYRREFIQVFNLMLDYAKPNNRELIVQAPLIDMSRKEVIKLGAQYKIPFEKTWSCYYKKDKPCGKCPPCITRASGFLKSNIPDPLILETVKARN